MDIKIPAGEEMWDEIGDWDWHIYTTMYKIKKLIRTYCIAQGTLLSAMW